MQLIIEEYDRAQVYKMIDKVYKDLQAKDLQKFVATRDKVFFEVENGTANKLNKVLGRCDYSKTSDDEFSIHLFLYPFSSDSQMYETILHELIHTNKSCHNHGSNFKKLANHFNKLLDVNITSTSSIEQFIDKDNLDDYYKSLGCKYKLVCKNCGQSSYFTKKIKMMDMTDRLTCRKCGHTGFNLETLS